jgi:hypothetical protein
MRTLTSLSAISALILSTAAANAVNGPNGKYAFISVESCEARLTLSKDINGKVTDVVINKSGMMSGGAGYVTFTPTSASGGKATITGSVLIEGGAVRVGNNGFNWSQKPDNQTGVTYSFTATTFTFGGQVYQMVGSNLPSPSKIYRNVYLIRRDTADGNANCVNTISATRVVP